MNLLQRLEQWGDRHHPRWMDIVRIALGAFLVYKAIDVLNNMSEMITLMDGNTNFGSFSYLLAVHYAVFAHILGGILLIAGMMVRFACLIQIPVLLGALFFLGTNREMLQPYSEIIISLVVLLLLVYFLFVGNGPWSLKLTDDGEKRKQAQ